MKGTWAWSLVQEDPTCCRATKPNGLKLLIHKPRVCATREASKMKSLHSAAGEQPPLATTRENLLPTRFRTAINIYFLKERLHWGDIGEKSSRERWIKWAGIWRKVPPSGSKTLRQVTPGAFEDHKETPLAGATGVSPARGLGGEVRRRVWSGHGRPCRPLWGLWLFSKWGGKITLQRINVPT